MAESSVNAMTDALTSEEKRELIELLELRGMTRMERLRYALEKQRSEWTWAHPGKDYGAWLAAENARAARALAFLGSKERKIKWHNVKTDQIRAHPIALPLVCTRKPSKTARTLRTGSALGATRPTRNSMKPSFAV